MRFKELPRITRWSIGITVVILFCEAFGYVAIRTRCHLTTKTLASEKLAHRRLTEVAKQLNVELALLKSPREITRRARNELGLRRPTPQQTLHIN